MDWSLISCPVCVLEAHRLVPFWFQHLIYLVMRKAKAASLLRLVAFALAISRLWHYVQSLISILIISSQNSVVFALY